MGILDFICWIFVALIIMFTVIGYCGMKYDSKDKDKEIKRLTQENLDLNRKIYNLKKKKEAHK